MTKDLILLVEDNHEIRESVTSILQVNGFDVLAAPHGENALEIIENTARIPDLIISDIRMPPGMTGYEFLDKIREKETYQNIPFIFLTALGEDHHVTFGWDKGIDGYIVKPFQAERFLATIRNRIHRTRQIRNVADNQLNRTRHALLQVLSHELRTPLTYVMGGMSLLEEELIQAELLNPQMASIVDVVHSGTNRLFRVAEQTSLLGELMSGHAAAHWGQIAQPVTLASLVSQAKDLMQAMANDKQITIKIIRTEDIEITGIENMLVKGVYEILHNGVQYSTKNAEVEVSYYGQDNRAIIAVRDTGRGILPEDIDVVWTLMAQSQREKFEHQGMGLGLTLAKGVFELHGGDASIESEYGVGTTVYLELPIHPTF